MSNEYYTVDEMLTMISEMGEAIGGFLGTGVTAAATTLRGATDAAGISNSDTPVLRNPSAPSGGGGSAPTVPLLPPIDPVAALRLLAEAISEAERTLNGDNLVIATGNVEVDLNLDVGGIVGAHAKFSLRIEPKPYG